MYFVPEGQHDRSLARSAWESVHRETRPVGVRYDRAQLNPELFLVEDACPVFIISSLQSNRCAGLPESDRTYGTAPLGGAGPRHFVPAYDRPVPPGRNTFAH
jgi:hypothetical protein